MEKAEVLIVDNLSKAFELTKQGPLLFKDVIRNGLKNLLNTHRAFQNPLWSLKDISFTVSKGETVGIIGANGAGKSTLLRIISGLMTPTSGRVILHQQIASILEIGSGFHPDLSGKENVFFNGQLMGYSKSDIEAQYQQIVDFSELKEFMYTPVKYYSSGMFLRLAFSIAVHFDRALMVFDEVLAVGDQHFQNKCMNKITELKNKNCTFLIVSHNFRDIANLCDRIIWLDKGKVYMDGPAYKVLTAYIQQEEDQEKERKKETASAPPLPTHVLKEEITEALSESHINICQFKVRQDSELEEGVFYNHLSIHFELDFSILRHEKVFDLAFVLRDALKTPLFGGGTFEFFNPIKPEKNLIYKMTWTIPGHLLGEGFFKLSLVEFLDKNRSFANYEFYEFEIRVEKKKEDPNPQFFTPIKPLLNIKVSPLKP